MENVNIKTITRDLTEMVKLAHGLKERGVAFTTRVRDDGLQILADEWDAICFSGTYGAERGLIECMGRTITGNDDVEGYLTADEILRRLDKA